MVEEKNGGSESEETKVSASYKDTDVDGKKDDMNLAAVSRSKRLHAALNIDNEGEVIFGYIRFVSITKKKKARSRKT